MDGQAVKLSSPQSHSHVYTQTGLMYCQLIAVFKDGNSIQLIFGFCDYRYSSSSPFLLRLIFLFVCTVTLGAPPVQRIKSVMNSKVTSRLVL